MPPDAIYLHSNVTGNREWLSYGNLWYGITMGGLYYLLSNNGLGDKSWPFATNAFYMQHESISLVWYYTYGFLNFGMSHCGITSIIGTPGYEDVIVRVATGGMCIICITNSCIRS